MTEPTALPMLLWCPECGARHIDEGKFATLLHHTHSCQSCGHSWRPAIAHTVGVQFLPGFKNPPREVPLDGPDPRRILRWFASEMEKALARNDYKDGFLDVTPGYCLRRLKQELQELKRDYPKNPKAAALEACDVANFAMMFAYALYDTSDKPRADELDEHGRTPEPPDPHYEAP